MIRFLRLGTLPGGEIEGGESLLGGYGGITCVVNMGITRDSSIVTCFRGFALVASDELLFVWWERADGFCYLDVYPRVLFREFNSPLLLVTVCSIVDMI